MESYTQSMEAYTQSLGKVSAWALIGGTAAATYTFYQGHQYAKKDNKSIPSWACYTLAIIASCYSFFAGALVGAAVKGRPPMEGIKWVIKAHYDYGPDYALTILKFPFNILKWLFTS